MMKRMLLFTAMSLLAIGAEAATTFTASVTSANGSLSTRLSWASPGATGCTASGHPSWTGAKPASGSVDLPAIALSGTYNLTLSCTIPGSTSATVTWTPPTQNTDGSALTNLKSYSVHYGKAADALAGTLSVNAPATTATVTGLDAGTWFFGVRAINANNVESALSNVAQKVISAATTETQSVTLTVNPVPKNPTGTTVQ